MQIVLMTLLNRQLSPLIIDFNINIDNNMGNNSKELLAILDTL